MSSPCKAHLALQFRPGYDAVAFPVADGGGDGLNKTDHPPSKAAAAAAPPPNLSPQHHHPLPLPSERRYHQPSFFRRSPSLGGPARPYGPRRRHRYASLSATPQILFGSDVL
jgi:hypothetical protein